MEEYAIPNRSFYRYLQIRHALEAQFSGKEPVWCEMFCLRKLVNASSTKGLISDLYGRLNATGQEGTVENKNRIKWEGDVGPLSDSQWEHVLALGPRISLSPSQIVSHLYLIYRTYYTPLKLFRFGKKPDAMC